MTQYVSSAEALNHVKSSDNIFIHSAAASPQQLIKALTARASELRAVKIYSIHTEGDCSYAKPEFENSFQIYCFFNGSNLRNTRPSLTPSFIPIFLSEVPSLFYNSIVPLDVALIQVSPPDRHGMCSLGPSVDVTLAALKTAKIVIAQVNPKMPRSFGDSEIEFNKIHFAVDVDEELHLAQTADPGETELQIGKNIAELIEDGSTLQLGIGAIPDATLKALTKHKNLGIHTEMFSDGLVDLFNTGAITNNQKKRLPGKIVTSFVLGTHKVYNFIDDNPMVVMMETAFTNDTSIISGNPKVAAINSAIEVDLTGQICADSIGSKIYSGIGGQMDFMRGAALSSGGKPIIALSSKTKKGESKINCFLKKGAGVTTTRAHVHYIVTEYGVAPLFGRSIQERIKALINIAAPEFREKLTYEAKNELFF